MCPCSYTATVNVDSKAFAHFFYAALRCQFVSVLGGFINFYGSNISNHQNPQKLGGNLKVIYSHSHLHPGGPIFPISALISSGAPRSLDHWCWPLWWPWWPWRSHGFGCFHEGLHLSLEKRWWIRVPKGPSGPKGMRNVGREKKSTKGCTTIWLYIYTYACWRVEVQNSI